MDTANKFKTIATIDINLVAKVGKEEWRQECLEEHLNCALCGTLLVFEHQTDFVTQTVTEDAHCPACRIRNKQSAHRLQ